VGEVGPVGFFRRFADVQEAEFRAQGVGDLQGMGEGDLIPLREIGGMKHGVDEEFGFVHGGECQR